MAFFDELGKKISQAGQSAVQKGKEIADIARINSSISDEERKIDDSYREIGKLYFSLHGENPDVDFAALVAGIQESGNKITEYRQQIKDIKGVVCCEKCGAEVSSNAAFCSSCGAPMPVVKPVETQPEENAAQVQPEAETVSAEQEAQPESTPQVQPEAESASAEQEAQPENTPQVQPEAESASAEQTVENTQA